MFPQFCRSARPALAPLALLAALLCGVGARGSMAAAEQVVTVDDFETGVGAWTRNDQGKTANPATEATLVEVVATPPGPGGPPGSKGAALFTFKAGHGTWASASLHVDGAAWAKAGAQRLTFWLSADGHPDGVSLLLRGTYKNADGATHEEVFSLPIPVRLDSTRWRRVAIPLTDFKGPSGPLPARIGGLYLLQFVERGTWDSRFFKVDDIQVEGTGIPIPQAVATAPPRVTPAPPVAVGTAPVSSSAVSVDFLRTAGRIHTAADVSLGAPLPAGATAGANPIVTNSPFRQAVGALKPRFVRVDVGALADLVDSGRPAFDFSRLQSVLGQVRALGSEPLLAMTNPAEWGLDERSYGSFCVLAVRAANQKTTKAVRYVELATGAGAGDDSRAIAFYNRGRAALKDLSPDLQVGGMSSGSERSTSMGAFLKGATGIDFLSVQFFGAPSGQPDAAQLFRAAQELVPLHQVAALLDRSRWRNLPIFVTQANLNAARSDTDPLPTDGRTVQMLSAAWWADLMANGSKVVDQVFHSSADVPEWGLLDEGARAYPAYYAMWLWNTYFAVGSDRVAVKVTGAGLVAAACNTATAHNLMLINTTSSDAVAQVGIRGFPILREARMRLFEDPQQSVQMQPLPKSPYQTIRLKPYAVAVVQFIEPPRSGR